VTGSELPPLLAGYPTDSGRADESAARDQPAPFDESAAFDETGSPVLRPVYRRLGSTLPHSGAALAELAARLRADHAEHGVRFGAAGRLYPLDPLPRLIGATEWAALQRGLIQRVAALDLFLADVYGPGRIIDAGVVPAEVVRASPQFSADAAATRPPSGVRVHVAGLDIVRDSSGTFTVLEDNLRCPSGAGYALANRAAVNRVWPALSAACSPRPVDDYAPKLLAALRAAAPAGVSDPGVVVLTSGPAGAAHVEHRMLAALMGVPLVGVDQLSVADGVVSATLPTGTSRVDVIYRRVDDEELGPGHPPGLLAAARNGAVVLANALGNGVGDDKGVYPYVPAMIGYYLGEQPLLPNVTTLRCWLPDERGEALARMADLVFKPVAGYGGQGIVFGPTTDRAGLARLREQVQADPRGWIAQPMLALSKLPTLVGGRLVPRRADLRPFVVNDGESLWVLPGGLTRVAADSDSLLVNSSQGGGSKDTWVVD